MAVYKYTSWGRTRRPKNLNGNTSTAVVSVHATDGTAPSAATHGYSTENQRYLHLNVACVGAGSKLTVYVYHHAFAAWSILMVPLGHPLNADGDAVVKNLDNSYVDVEITGISAAKRTYIFDILGADRVAFVANNATHAFTVYGATSTF